MAFEEMLDSAWNYGGFAVWAVVNTGILVYVLKDIKSELKTLNANFETYLKKRR